MTTKAYEIGQLGISLVVSDTGEITALNINTNQVSEGTTNKYYTDTKVGTYLTANNYATQSYVTTAVSNVIDGAPGALNTLNELAAALNDDASFASTITTALGNKLNTSDFTTTANAWLGSNEYFTTAKARASVSGGTIISYNSTTGVIGVNDASIGISKFDSTVANTFSTKGTSIAMAIALG